jgi:hypothetical protein
MSGEPGAMVGYLRGDELQLMFPSLGKANATRRRADVVHKREQLARRASKKSMPPRQRHKTLERLETRLVTAARTLGEAKRVENSVLAAVEAERDKVARARERESKPARERASSAPAHRPRPRRVQDGQGTPGGGP